VHEPDVVVRPDRRRRFWIALAVTAVAVPVLVVDNLPDEPERSDAPASIGVVTPVRAPVDRAPSGPPKGASVVTSSTTSSTLPITTSTTTTPS